MELRDLQGYTQQHLDDHVLPEIEPRSGACKTHALTLVLSPWPQINVLTHFLRELQLLQLV